MAELPVPIIPPHGEPDTIWIDGYYPGDPLPASIHRSDGMDFVYDPKREAYVKDTTHVLPVQMILPNGERRPVELAWWWPGDKYPNHFFQGGVRYSFDKRRNAYVRGGSEIAKPSGFGALGLTIWWAWLPSWFFGYVAATATATPGGYYGSRNPNDGLGFIVFGAAMLGFWLFVYAFRLNRAERHNNRHSF